MEKTLATSAGLLALWWVAATAAGVESSTGSAPKLEPQPANLIPFCQISCPDGSILSCSVTPCTTLDPQTINCNGTSLTCPNPPTIPPQPFSCRAIADCNDGLTVSCTGTSYCDSSHYCYAECDGFIKKCKRMVLPCP